MFQCISGIGHDVQSIILKDRTEFGQGRGPGKGFAAREGRALDVFDGKDAEGRRMGVYVEKKGKEISYTINGIFPDPIAGKLPMTELEKEDLLKIEAPYNPLIEQGESGISASDTRCASYSPGPCPR